MKPTADILNPKRKARLSKSPWKLAMKRFRSNPRNRFALWIIKILLFIAIFADFLASDKPIYAVYEGQTYFPVLREYGHKTGINPWGKDLIKADWSKLPLTSSIWPPVRYAPDHVDKKNPRDISPFGKQKVEKWQNWHYFGTDSKGRDVLSGLIHGTRISLMIGLIAMGIAGTIGVLIGAFAGYFGDDRLKITRISGLLFLLALPLAWFYGFSSRNYILGDALSEGFFGFMGELILSLLVFAGVIAVFQLPGLFLRKIPFLGKNISVWVDILISRVMEILMSIPRLLLLITISGLLNPGSESVYLTMVILGLMSWMGIARIMRGEMLRIRELEYIQAAHAIGMKKRRIILRHALPNALGPILVILAFGVAGAILAESSLSFLSIGVPQGTVTWGALLNEARQNVDSWWLVMFPGFAIFITITLFNLLGEGLRDALDPRLHD